jgi:prepilin-type N-terminal cleavage/methylation domain-containing protein
MNSQSPLDAIGTADDRRRPYKVPRIALALLTSSPVNASSAHRNGFTLIESLVGIIIIAITIVSIIPPVFWATATRVQNRRAEQAIALAQSEIDRVRTSVERRENSLVTLPPSAGTDLKPVVGAPTSVEDAVLRSQNPACAKGDDRQPSSALKVILVDTDPDGPGVCKPEFMIQVFRGKGLPESTATTTAIPDAFVMGVRVYAISARANLGKDALKTSQANLRGGNGLGSQQFRPLAAQYSTIVRSNLRDGLDLYRQLCEKANEACLDQPSR